MIQRRKDGAASRAVALRWFDESAALLLWSKYDGMLVTWGAYFDDSEAKRNLAVAGCVAPLEAWRGFTLAWIDVLEEFGICWFHATDCASSKQEFVTWKGDDPRRQDFYGRLVKLLEQFHVRPVGYIIPADFNLPGSGVKAPRPTRQSFKQ